MRNPKTFLALGLAALSLGALAQTPPPHPPVGGPAAGPGPRGPMGPGGPDLLMDPKVQKELSLSQEQIAKIRAVRPAPPKPGAKPPLPPKPGAKPPVPPKPGVEEAKIDAILTKGQRDQLRAMRGRRDARGPEGGPRPGGPRPPADGPKPPQGGAGTPPPAGGDKPAKA